jgi:hypothetical protein
MQQTRGLVTYIGPNEAIGSPDHQAFLSVPSKVEYPRYGYERIATKHPAPLTGTITTEWTIKIDTCLCSLQERHHPQYPPVRKAPSLSHLRDIPPMYPVICLGEIQFKHHSRLGPMQNLLGCHYTISYVPPFNKGSLSVRDKPHYYWKQSSP